MKKMLLSLSLITFCGAAFGEEDVRIVSEINSEKCRMVTEKVCETRKTAEEKAVAKCESWHKKEARKVDANRVVIVDVTYDEHRRPHYDGSTKIIKNREYIAQYYACEKGSDIESGDSGTSGELPQKYQKSIEERLRLIEDLKQKGLISETEYQSKRSEILSEI